MRGGRGYWVEALKGVQWYPMVSNVHVRQQQLSGQSPFDALLVQHLLHVDVYNFYTLYTFYTFCSVDSTLAPPSTTTVCKTCAALKNCNSSAGMTCWYMQLFPFLSLICSKEPRLCAGFSQPALMHRHLGQLVEKFIWRPLVANGLLGFVSTFPLFNIPSCTWSQSKIGFLRLAPAQERLCLIISFSSGLSHCSDSTLDFCNISHFKCVN